MSSAKEAVIALHGLANAPLCMWRLAKALRAQGYDVYNWGYNTFKGGMHDQLARLDARLPELKAYKKVHGVGHSLGGLMLRGLFARNTHALKLGRLVMLGSPNQGAGTVNKHKYLLKGPLNRQIIHDLAEGSEAIGKLGIPKTEIGVIAGIEKFNPINPVAWLNARTFGDVPNDGTVEAHNTRLPGMTDYIELPYNHLALPYRAEVIAASVKFIKTGKFTS